MRRRPHQPAPGWVSLAQAEAIWARGGLVSPLYEGDQYRIERRARKQMEWFDSQSRVVRQILREGTDAI